MFNEFIVHLNLLSNLLNCYLFYLVHLFCVGNMDMSFPFEWLYLIDYSSEKGLVLF